MSAVEKFPILLSEAEEESSAVPPCFSDEGINVSRQTGLRLYLRHPADHPGNEDKTTAEAFHITHL